MLEVKKLNKSFGDNVVLKNIDFKVDKGEVIALLGPSGSGKTTLLRCISFLERVEQGEIIFDELHYDMAHIAADILENSECTWDLYFKILIFFVI